VPHPHRLSNSAYVGQQQYLLTICTHSRRRLFVDRDLVDLVLSHFRRSGVAHGCALLAYCFMPDHVHLLVNALTERSDFRRFVIKAKQASGFACAKAERGRLWQQDFWDYALRSEDMLVQKIAYLVANPIRAGLVDSIDAYPFFGSDVYSREELIQFVQENLRRTASSR
jgi:putative transposase